MLFRWIKARDRCRACRTGCDAAAVSAGGGLAADTVAAAGQRRVALAGNPNTGKSTIFNALTGLRQHTGNWPGKTVARAEGVYHHAGIAHTLVDLPGTYSLLSASVDEQIARDFILFGEPDCTIVVVDVTALERNLNLVLQVLEIAPRVVVAANLMDEARRRGLSVDVPALARRLGVPVVATSARRGQGLEELMRQVDAVISGRVNVTPLRARLPEPIQRAVDELAPMIQSLAPGLPNVRWVAYRLLEGDQRVRQALESGELAQVARRLQRLRLPVLEELPHRAPAPMEMP